MSAEPVLVVGVGAMGCLFAARLAASGIAVCMLGGWPEALEVLNRDGVTLSDATGRTASYPVRAVSDARAIGNVRLALVLVKAWQTAAAAEKLTHCLAPEGVALSLQNGLGNRETLAAVLGEERSALGVTTAGASLLAPGVVRVGGEGTVTLACAENSVDAAQILLGARFVTETSPDLLALQWGKLVINSAINPLTAILNVPNGELLERPAARALMSELALETAGVAYASQIALPYPDPVAAVEKVAGQTARNISSMLQDVRRGAPTEIDAINGAVALRAAVAGHSAPLNWSLWQLVQSLSHL